MEKNSEIMKENKKKDLYYEKLHKEFNKSKYAWENKWLENGWIYFGLGILFLLIHFFREGFTFSGTYFYVGCIWLVISVVVLFIGYRK